MQQHVVERLAPALGGLQEDTQVLFDFRLPDKFSQPFGPQRVFIGIVFAHFRRDHPFGHSFFLFVAYHAHPKLRACHPNMLARNIHEKKKLP